MPHDVEAGGRLTLLDDRGARRVLLRLQVRQQHVQRRGVEVLEETRARERLALRQPTLPEAKVPLDRLAPRVGEAPQDAQRTEPAGRLAVSLRAARDRLVLQQPPLPADAVEP